MSLKDVYQRFLANPASAPLASNASLIYITTTTKLDGASAVVSHLTKQQRIVKTRSENVLDVIESANSLCLDIETTLEFVSGGGAYLPSLDDNFLADHVATFPTVRRAPCDLLLLLFFYTCTNAAFCFLRRSISFALIRRIRSKMSESIGTKRRY